MHGHHAGDITRLLWSLEEGHAGALDQLTPLVYDELHRIARAQMAQERRDHTLQPTALINQAFVDILRREGHAWENRTHFFRSIAAAMRLILVNHARDRNRLKRGGKAGKLPLNDFLASYEKQSGDIIALHDALTRLSEIDARQAELVQLRFFAGLSVKDCADLLSVSERTAKNDWQMARTWLWRQLGDP